MDLQLPIGKEDPTAIVHEGEKPTTPEPTSREPGLLTLEELQKKIVIERYELMNRNKAKTAESLGITLKTVYNKLQMYGFYQPRSTK